ncbi:ABC transporter permease [Agrococcus carbonis]|uniref:ABC transporter permease n=1 Tax=Agrococcus carbonis TaxID=684552 RepID=UPI0012F8C74F|nr:ABC transporter permease subunit [Agrococcus carbonis]
MLALLGAGSVALLAAPVVYLVVRAFGADPLASLPLVVRPRTGELLLTSLALALLVAVAVGALGTLQALLLARLRLPASRALLALAALPLAMPSYVAAFGWLGLVPSMQGFWAAWLQLTIVSTPYVTLPVHAALRSAPAGLEIAARSLGRGPLAALRQVTWPIVRPAATAGALLAGLYALADFGVVSLMRVETLSTGIARAMGAGFDRSYAALLGLVLVAAAIALVLLEQRVRRAVPAARVRSAAPPRIDVGRWTPVAVAAVLTTPIVAIGVPVATLVTRALEAQSVRTLEWAELLQAAGTSVSLAIAAGILATVLAAPIALLAARHPSPVSRALEGAATIAHALPGIVVGLSLVFLSLALVPWAYQTVGVLIAAYALLAAPRAVGGVRAALERVPMRYEHLARSLGRRRAAAFSSTTGRIAAGGVGVAALLAAVAALKELPATLLLRPTGVDTLATALWARTDVSEYGAAAPFALALIACAAVPAMLVLVTSVQRDQDADLGGRSAAP